MEKRHGKQWTKEEDKVLKKLFDNHKTFYEMSKELERTWFACKCRLARLGLIDMSADENLKWAEKYRVPNPVKFTQFEELKDMLRVGFTVQVPKEECELVEHTFDDDELDIISSYLQSRYARVAVASLEQHCFLKDKELQHSKEILENEIKVIKSLKKMTIEEREQVIKKLC